MKKPAGARFTRINKRDVTEITVSSRDAMVITLHHDEQEVTIIVTCTADRKRRLYAAWMLCRRVVARNRASYDRLKQQD